MKRKFWVWLFVGITLFLLIASLVLALVIGWHKLRWIFWGTLIASALGWIIYVIVYAIQLLGNQAPVEKLDVDDAISKEVEAVKNDINYSDNFIPDGHEMGRFGVKGQETPVLVVYGYGTEMKSNRVSIINMNNKKETTRKVNVTDAQIDRLKNIIAEHPDTQARENIERLDPFGKVTERISRPTPSSQKERDELEKAKAEEKIAS